MDYKSSEIKAGIFIVISVIIFIGFLAIIIGMNSFTEKQNYSARFKYVGGVERGSAVRYAGLLVGSVIEIKLTNDGFPGAEITMQIENDVPIRANSTAYLTTVGIMGSYYVEIVPGSEDQPLLPPGSLIPSHEVLAFSQMSEPAADVLEQTTSMINRMNALLSEENINYISEMIHSLNKMSLNTENGLEEITNNINILITDIQDMTKSVKDVVVANDQSISNSIETLEDIMLESKSSVQKLNAILSEIDQSIFQNQSQYTQIIENMNAITQNLQDFSQSIKERPWNLVRKSVPSERKLP